MKTTKEKIEVMQAYEDGQLIEFTRIDRHDWRVVSDPVWNWDDIDYRIKQSTILVNGIEVPGPVGVMPLYGTTYHYPAFTVTDGVASCRVTGYGDDVDMAILESGTMHLTESAARQHYEALIAPSRAKK